MIFDNVMVGDRIKVTDAEGIERFGVALRIVRAVDPAMAFQEVDSNALIPMRTLRPRDIKSIEPWLVTDDGSTPSEAEVFFRGADLEGCVTVVLSCKAVMDFIAPPNEESFEVLVDQVVTELRSEINVKSKVPGVTERALDAFWQVVAAEFNEVPTGDLPPEIVVGFDRIAKETVDTWLDYNLPGGEASVD